jgi:hypothetical protein
MEAVVPKTKRTITTLSDSQASGPRQRKTGAPTSGKARKTSPPNPKPKGESKQNLVIQTQAAIRRHRPGHHREDELAAALGAWLLQRPREEEAQAPAVSDVGKDRVRRYHIAAVAPGKN